MKPKLPLIFEKFWGPNQNNPQPSSVPPQVKRTNFVGKKVHTASGCEVEALRQKLQSVEAERDKWKTEASRLKKESKRYTPEWLRELLSQSISQNSAKLYQLRRPPEMPGEDYEIVVWPRVGMAKDHHVDMPVRTISSHLVKIKETLEKCPSCSEHSETLADGLSGLAREATNKQPISQPPDYKSESHMQGQSQGSSLSVLADAADTVAREDNNNERYGTSSQDSSSAQARKRKLETDETSCVSKDPKDRRVSRLASLRSAHRRKK